MNASRAIRETVPRRALTAEQELQVIQMFNEGATMARIATWMGCSLEPVKRVLNLSPDKVTRPRRVVRRILSDDTVTAILARDEAGETVHHIGQALGLYDQLVRTALRHAGRELRDGRNRRGPDSPLYTTGRSLNAEGYVRILVPDDSPFASMGNSRRRVSEHRLVMAEHLGRALYPHETVHHRNGVKTDNRIENLELWETGQPYGQRQSEAAFRHCPTCTCRQDAAM